MSRSMTRKESLEIQAGADALLTPGGGGLAIWVRRDELQPRVAVRLSTAKKEGEDISVEKIATLLATLRCGLDRVTEGLADKMQMPREDLARMVEKAHELLLPHVQSTTNVQHGQARAEP